MSCPSCGAAVAGGARFCAACGHDLSARGDERRVVTVLFADLVGFTTLSESLDPERVKDLVDGCFELLAGEIAACGGQVDKFIGDAVVALFGAPVAHEDDAERAVRSALRMQAALAGYAAAQAHGAPLRMRVGVNTGEVLVGALRAGGSTTAMGDVVNTANRLQAAAPPGAVLVGPATHAATRDAIRYRSEGAVAARGREEPVEAWVALEPTAPPGHRPRRRRAPLVGRGREVDLLAHAIDGGVAHSRAQLVVLFGEAGLGKTRLATEVADRAEREHGALVLHGRCVPYGEANPWWPVAEALGQACGLEPGADAATARDRTAATVGATLPDAEEAERSRVVEGLLHLQGLETPLRGIEPARAGDEATRALGRFLAAAARRRPVVVALADLHWADDLVLALLDELLDRLARLPFVLVGTARPALAERWRAPIGGHDAVVLHLDPLSRAAAGELLDALVDDVSGHDREPLLDRAGGNPFFLEELVALTADGDRPDRYGPSLPASDLPATLRGLVATRLDALAPTERSVLEDAAVIGRRGPVDALSRMAEAQRVGGDVSAAVGALVDSEVLTVEGDMWSFRSDVVREVAYATLTKAGRARRHHGIASFLERRLAAAEPDDAYVDLLSHHYGAAARLATELGHVDLLPAGAVERALAWVGVAVARTERAEHHLAAARLTTDALEVVGDEPSAARAGLLVSRARARLSLRRLDGARADLDAVEADADTLDDPVLAARALLLRGELRDKEGAGGEAVVLLERAAAAFAELGDHQGRAEALRLQGMVELFSGAIDAASASIGAALEAFRAVGDRRGEGWALQNLAWIAYYEGDGDEAEARLGESSATFEALGDAAGLGWALGLLAFVRFHQGSVAEAEELAARVLGNARDLGDRWGAGMMLVLTSLLRLWTGRATEADERGAEAREVFVLLDDRFGCSQAAGASGRALVSVGRVDEGFAVLAKPGGSAGAPGIDLAPVVASAAVQVGDPARALAAIGSLEGSITDRPRPRLMAGERVVAEGLARLQQGDAAEAERLLAAACHPPGAGGPFARSALALARSARGAPQGEVEGLVAEVHRAPAATYLDRATGEVAVALDAVRAGDEREARAQLDAARRRVDDTEDRVAQAVVRLATSIALDALGAPDATEAAAGARSRLDELGISAAGWARAFTLAATGGA